MTEACPPAVTAEQMREVHRATIEYFHFELVQMMENAGRGLAELAVDLFTPRRVLVVARPGGNGGGGLVRARHLSNRGVLVRVLLATRSTGSRRCRGTAGHSYPDARTRGGPDRQPV